MVSRSDLDGYARAVMKLAPLESVHFRDNRAVLLWVYGWTLRSWPQAVLYSRPAHAAVYGRLRRAYKVLLGLPCPPGSKNRSGSILLNQVVALISNQIFFGAV